MPGIYLKIVWQARLVEDSPAYTPIAPTIFNHYAISSIHLSIVTITHICLWGRILWDRAKEHTCCTAVDQRAL